MIDKVHHEVPDDGLVEEHLPETLPDLRLGDLKKRLFDESTKITTLT